MRHSYGSTWTALAIATSIASAAAQTRQPAARPTADIGRAVTLRGCLQSWDGSPTGIGRGDVSGGPMQFVLTKAEEAAAATAPMPTGTSGTAPSTPAPMAHDTYVVQPLDGQVELHSFLDQQVEVTGTLEVIPPHDAGAAGTRPDAGAPGQTAAPQPAAPNVPGTQPPTTQAPPRTPMQRLLVASMKTVAKRCP
jgi:hypothetical protein